MDRNEVIFMQMQRAFRQAEKTSIRILESSNPDYWMNLYLMSHEGWMNIYKTLCAKLGVPIMEYSMNELLEMVKPIVVLEKRN